MISKYHMVFNNFIGVTLIHNENLKNNKNKKKKNKNFKDATCRVEQKVDEPL